MPRLPSSGPTVESASAYPSSKVMAISLLPGCPNGAKGMLYWEETDCRVSTWRKKSARDMV